MIIQPAPHLEFMLLPSRSLHWPSRNIVVVADLHLGRIVPRAPKVIEYVEESMQRLARVLQQTHARKLVFLGDVFHMRNNYHHDVVQTFAQWRSQFADIEMVLIRGNHERAMGDPPAHLHLDCRDPGYHEAGVTFLHEPRQMDTFTMCAHLHPCLLVPTERALATTVPCFVWNSDYLYMPAFEDTMPGRVISRRTNEQYACIHNQTVVINQ